MDHSITVLDLPATERGEPIYVRPEVLPQIVLAESSYEDRSATSERIGQLIGALVCLHTIPVLGTIDVSMVGGRLTITDNVVILDEAGRAPAEYACQRIEELAAALAEERGPFIRRLGIRVRYNEAS